MHRPALLDAAAKRAVDVGLAASGLLVSLPVSLLVAIAIRLEDGGPVFYRQRRVGREGKLFTSWKFRSMAPRDPCGPLLQAGLEASRVTRIGRLLRACALDELPQLWNILRGDMSFVGPRALLPEEVETAGGGSPVRLRDLRGFEERHAVRPGLTGLAQVRAARDVPHQQKFRYDLLYVRRRTLWLDLELIVRSVWISLRAAWPQVGRRREPIAYTGRSAYTGPP